MKYSHLDSNQFKSIINWINGIQDNHIINNIANLNIRYTKSQILYRGIRIDHKKYFTKLLNNKIFKLNFNNLVVFLDKKYYFKKYNRLNFICKNNKVLFQKR